LISLVKRYLFIFILLVLVPVAYSAVIYLLGDTDGGPLQRRAAAEGFRPSASPDQGFRGAHRSLARHLRGSYLDRGEGARS
jgi:hypothetical protein